MPYNSSLLLIAATLLLTTCFQQSKRNPNLPVGIGVATVKATEWSLFSPKDGGFEVMLPGKPTWTPSGNTEYGPVPSTRYSLRSGKFWYAVTYMEYPHSKESLKARVEHMKMVAETGITKFGGKLVSSKAVSLGDFPGREVTATFKESFYRSRSYIGNQRLYTLQVIVDGGERGSENENKFFDSFKILPEALARP